MEFMFGRKLIKIEIDNKKKGFMKLQMYNNNSLLSCIVQKQLLHFDPLIFLVSEHYKESKPPRKFSKLKWILIYFDLLP